MEIKLTKPVTNGRPAIDFVGLNSENGPFLTLNAGQAIKAHSYHSTETLMVSVCAYGRRGQPGTMEKLPLSGGIIGDFWKTKALIEGGTALLTELKNAVGLIGLPIHPDDVVKFRTTWQALIEKIERGEA